MKNRWNNVVLMDVAGVTDGGGGSGAGASSILTPPSGGSTTPPAAGNANTTPGAANPQPTVPNTNAGGTTPGANNQDWRSQLPPELQEDASIKKFGSLSALAAGYVSASKLIGTDKIPVPSVNTSEEQWQEIYQKLGVPKEAKDYAVKFKEGTQLDSKFTDEFRSNAHKFGVLPKQAQALADWFSDINLKADSDMKAAAIQKTVDGVAAIKQEWGQAFPGKAARVNKLLEEVGGADTLKYFHESGLGADPVVLRVLSAAADKMYKEGKIVGADGGSGDGMLSPSEAKAAYNKIIGDKTHAYNLKEHPGHADAVKHVKDLFEMQYPTQKV